MQQSLIMWEIILSVAVGKLMLNVITWRMSRMKRYFSVQTPLRNTREKGRENLQDFSPIHPLLFPARLVAQKAVERWYLWLPDILGKKWSSSWMDSPFHVISQCQRLCCASTHILLLSLSNKVPCQWVYFFNRLLKLIWLWIKMLLTLWQCKWIQNEALLKEGMMESLQGSILIVPSWLCIRFTQNKTAFSCANLQVLCGFWDSRGFLSSHSSLL